MRTCLNGFSNQRFQNSLFPVLPTDKTTTSNVKGVNHLQSLWRSLASYSLFISVALHSVQFYFVELLAKKYNNSLRENPGS